MINITVASGQEHDRKTIAAILAKQKDFRIASLGVDGYDALISAKKQHPDIIIMDFSMNDSKCTDLAPVIKRNSPSTAIIVLCSCHEHSVAGRALRAGVSGCLSRQGDFDSLPASVRCVYYGGLYLSKPIKNHVLGTIEKPQAHCIAEKFFSLTELRIFLGIALGHTDENIAKSLNISTGTLRNSIARVKERTRLQNRTQMALFALSVTMMSRGSTIGQLAEISQ